MALPPRESPVDRRLSTGRRRFINACVLAGASGVSSGPIAAANTLSGGGQLCSKGKCGDLVHMRQDVAAVGNEASYYRLRKTLAARAINPWLRSWMDELDEALPLRFEALVEARHKDGETAFGTLLDFSESFDPEADEHALSFVEWLPRFKPEGRDDFLMALPLYRAYGNTGKIFPARSLTPDPWLDAMLGSTRGMLVWTGQWIELISAICGVDRGRAYILLRGYLYQGDSIANRALNKARYVGTGQTVEQIIAERSLGQHPWGNPDYPAGDWLYRHWHSG